jgi:hypothetical protein
MEVTDAALVVLSSWTAGCFVMVFFLWLLVVTWATCFWGHQQNGTLASLVAVVINFDFNGRNGVLVVVGGV